MDDDKTIPFLRRLASMLQENSDAISFYPGGEDPKHPYGRIVIHNRAKVEHEVLPKYFNHSSFASLRRQLNYFAFVRVGKGRKQNAGATYCNPYVKVLDDIFTLKRRTGVNASGNSMVSMSFLPEDDPSFKPYASPGISATNAKATRKSERVRVQTNDAALDGSKLIPTVSFQSIYESEDTLEGDEDESTSSVLPVTSSSPPNKKQKLTPRIVLDLTHPKQVQGEEIIDGLSDNPFHFEAPQVDEPDIDFRPKMKQKTSRKQVATNKMKILSEGLEREDILVCATLMQLHYSN